MKVVACGTVVPAKYETTITDLSIAGNRFMLNFVDTMAKREEVTCISYVGVGVDGEIAERMCNEKDFSFPIRYYFRSKHRVKGILAVIRGIRKELSDADCLITYNTIYAWLFAPLQAHIRRKKAILILADYTPPESMRSFSRKLYAWLQLRSIRKYDYVVGLSVASRKYLKPRQKFICMQGGITDEFYHYFGEYQKRKREDIILMYSGVLESVTGIPLLLDAFEKIENPNVKLYISGKGKMSGTVREYAIKDARIQYYGILPYEEYLAKIQESDILINPRDMNELENQNNFPSKIMEYLATGKYIVSTKFPGWEKYRPYMAFCGSTRVALQKEMEKAIASVKNEDETQFEKRRSYATQFRWKSQIDSLLKYVKEN